MFCNLATMDVSMGVTVVMDSDGRANVWAQSVSRLERRQSRGQRGGSNKSSSGQDSGSLAVQSWRRAMVWVDDGPGGRGL
jgi:hypothetical protein